MSQLYESLNLKERIREVFIGTEIIIFLALIGNYYSSQSMVVVGLLLLIFFLMFAPIIALANNKINLANGLFLSILSVTLVAIVWFNHGLKDTGLLAFPALLIYAAILGTNVQFFATTIFLCLATMFLGFAHLFNLKTFEEPNVYMVDLIDIPLILLITAFALRALFVDVRSHFDEIKSKDKSSREESGSYEDRLTGLPDRRIAEDSFNRALLHQNNPGSWLSLVSIDLDDFRPINDDFGYDVGDALLVQIAKRLIPLAGKNDHLYRFSGDEFKFIIRSTPDMTSFAEKIIQATQEEFRVGPHRIRITCSIGIYEVTSPNDSFSQALKRSEIAMLQTKLQKGNGYKFYDSSTMSA